MKPSNLRLQSLPPPGQINQRIGYFRYNLGIVNFTLIRLGVRCATPCTVPGAGLGWAA